jgi:regulator of protease activity HflC (stomatin/prohibitin superfamily)
MKLFNQARNQKGQTGMGIVITLAVFLFIVIASCITTITPGMAGVIYNRNGGIENETLGQGWHVISWWKSVTEYPISTETVYLTKSSQEGEKQDDSFNSATKEGMPVNMDVMYSYHVDVVKLPHVYTKFRGANIQTIESGYIKTQLKSLTQVVTSQYSILEIFGNKRSEIQSKIFELLKNDLVNDGFVLESFSFGEIRPDKASKAAIQAKVNAQQVQQQKVTEMETAKIEADKKRIEAQGEADAAFIKAQGVAKANETTKLSLSRDLIDYTIAQKWNGQVPQVSGNNGVLLQLPTSK